MPAVGEGFALLCSDAASAACWSASGIARCATFLPLTHGRPPRVRVPIAGAFASRLTRGAYAPRSWLYMRLCIAKVAISPARVRALKQERRASARRGYRYGTCDGASTNSRQTADGACAVRRCSSGQAYHGGLTPPALVLQCEGVPAKNDFCDARTHVRRSGGRQPAVGVGKTFTQTKARLFGRPPTVRVPMAVAFASRLTRGANAPRSCVAVRTFAGEKTIFAMHERTSTRAANVSPPWGAGLCRSKPSRPWSLP
jgi:hypothetical protein